MYFHLSLASTVLLAGNALAQYAGGYNYDSGSGNSQSGASGSSGTSDSLSVSMPMSTSVATPSAAISTATPSSGQVMVHVVKVSNKKGSLTFEPNNLQVPAGHMVQFHFYPKVSTPQIKLSRPNIRDVNAGYHLEPQRRSVDIRSTMPAD